MVSIGGHVRNYLLLSAQYWGSSGQYWGLCHKLSTTEWSVLGVISETNYYWVVSIEGHVRN